MNAPPEKRVDLGPLSEALTGQLDISVKPTEHDDERSARLRREDWRFWMGHAWTLFTLLILRIISYILYRHIADTDPKIAEWARTGLSVILSGVVAFFTGMKIGGGKVS